MEIPQQLQNEEFRFVLLGKWNIWKNTKTKEENIVAPEDFEKYNSNKEWKPLGKAPFEKDWQNKGYKFNDPKLLKHPNNFGIIGGYGNLILLDKDSKDLPIDLDTFTIKTGSGGLHYYILSDYKYNHVFINEMGELRANNYQCVCPNSIHPNGNKYEVLKDIPIKFIPAEELKDIIKPYLREEQPIQISKDNKKEDTSRSGYEYRKVLSLLRKGYSRAEVYDVMKVYAKWSSSDEQYKTLTFEKAENFYLQEQEKQKEEEKKEVIEEPKEIDIEILKKVYEDIVNLLKKYVDMKENYYSIIALWIIGTWTHESFETYPYLFLNATKGSAKTRLLKLIKALSKDGDILNSLTEAVLFRTKGTLCIDEFEGISKKGQENLRELLNSAYKKGTKVKRMKRVKTEKGEEMIVEQFDVYRPICMANIWGLENVLQDRCLTIILEKSNDKSRTKLVEDFDSNIVINNLIAILKSYSVSVSCVVYLSENNVYKKWNDYILSTYKNSSFSIDTQDTLYTLHTYDTQDTLCDIFKKIDDSGIDGRNLELSFPIFLTTINFCKDRLDDIIKIVGEIIQERKVEDLTSNYDISLVDFISQEVENDYFMRIGEITQKFKDFLQENPDWLNNDWIGRALRRLNLVRQSRRLGRGKEVVLNYKKAQEKIKIFK